jgi:acyl carrier protein
MNASGKIKKTILDFLLENNPNKDLSTLSETANLLEADLLTSIDFVTLIQILEEETGLEIDFTEVDPAALITLEGLQQYFGAASTEA